MHLYFEFEDLGADQGKTKHGMPWCTVSFWGQYLDLFP